MSYFKDDEYNKHIPRGNVFNPEEFLSIHVYDALHVTLLLLHTSSAIQANVEIGDK